jgi:hypothetical protein
MRCDAVQKQERSNYNYFLLQVLLQVLIGGNPFKLDPEKETRRLSGC